MKTLITFIVFTAFACNQIKGQIIIENMREHSCVIEKDSKEYSRELREYLGVNKVIIRNSYSISLFFSLRFMCETCPWKNYEIGPNSILTFDLEDFESFDFRIRTNGFPDIRYKLEGGKKFFFSQNPNGQWDLYHLKK